MRVTLSSGNRVTIPKAVMEELNLTLGQSLELNIVNGNIVITSDLVNKVSYEDLYPSTNVAEVESNNVTNDGLLNKDITEIIEENNCELEEELKEKPVQESKPFTFPTFNPFKKEEPKKEEPVRYKRVMVNGIKIVSNLEEGAKFSRKVYSECNLVIRTKRSSIDRFCEACQGELAYQYGVLNHPCKYINIPERVELEEPKKVEPKKVELEEPKKENPVKTIVKKLADNVSRLDSQLDRRINSHYLDAISDIESYNDSIDDYYNDFEEPEFKENSELDNIMKDQYRHIKKTVIRPVKCNNSVRRCTNCNEFFSKGFLLDSQFYCKSCTMQDFKNFLNIRKECE